MKQVSATISNPFFKVLAFSAAFALLSKQDNAQICSSSVIYSLSNAGGIYPITVSDGSVGTIVNSTSYGSSTSANSIGYNTLNGLFYYFQVALSGTKQFVSYNPSTNVYTTLAPSSISATVNRGCVSFDGTGYYCLDVNGNLYYYNIPSNTWTLICSTFKDQFNNNVTSTFSSESSGDMAIDGLGNLWIVASNSSKWSLYKLSAPLATTSVASITVQQLVAPTTATPSGAGFVGIAFSSNGNIYMGTTTDLYVLQPSFTLSHIGAFSATGICGDLASCNYPFSILPVTWESFYATSKGNGYVDLSWEVTQQQKDKGYYVERSIDGTSWSEIGFVVTFGGYESTEDYAYTDNNPDNGKNYYRIKQVDINGDSSLSEIKTVTLAKASSKLSVWPNPARDVIRIQNNGSTGVVNIYNQSGSMVSESKLQAGVNSINVNSLSFGAYIISVKNVNGESYNQKFIKE
jgi:type IX secretion system substrate protein